MEKIKLNLFDTFAYLIPGILVVLSISIAYNAEIESLSDIPNSYKGFTTPEILFTLLVAYIIGIICNFFGHHLYQLAKKIWKKDVIIHEDYHLTDTEIHVLIRELSPNNYSFLQSWLGLSNMSHNIALAMLIIVSVAIFKMFQVDTVKIWEWIFVLIISLISVIIFLKRSIRFNNYFKLEAVATIEKLEILKKAKKVG